MLSKEEIEKMKKYFNECIIKEHIFEEDFTIEFMKNALQYIDQLENKVKEIEKENDKLTYARNWYFENTVNKIVTPEMLHKILRTKYIDTDKIKNKIAEINKDIEKYREYTEQGIETDTEWVDNVANRQIVKVLQELLDTD